MTHKVFQLTYLGEGLEVRREGDQTPPPLVDFLLDDGGLPDMTISECEQLASKLRRLAANILKEFTP